MIFIKPVFVPNDYKPPSRLRECWWWIDRKLISPWWIPVRNVFCPHNVQKIRNTPRSWNDRSERVVHCVFSMLCDFVEYEHDGRDDFADYVLQTGCPVHAEVLTCYDWYTKRDWDEPFGMEWSKENSDAYFEAERKFEEETSAMLVRAIATRGVWWT